MTDVSQRQVEDEVESVIVERTPAQAVAAEWL